ncbi:MAG: hypothetical protein ACQETD_01565 [Pseudomonadota bacterium]
MASRSSYLRSLTAIPMALIAGLYLTPAGASSYLQELEMEAAKSSEAEKQPRPSVDVPSTPEKEGEKLEAGLSHEQFESTLQEGYYGSYLFYSTLEEGQQQSVYEDYQSDNSLDSIRESIKNRLKNQ